MAAASSAAAGCCAPTPTRTASLLANATVQQSPMELANGSLTETRENLEQGSSDGIDPVARVVSDGTSYSSSSILLILWEVS